MYDLIVMHRACGASGTPPCSSLRPRIHVVGALATLRTILSFWQSIACYVGERILPPRITGPTTRNCSREARKC